MTDPPLKGPDPIWADIRTGKGHVYYALAAIIALSPFAGRVGIPIAACAAGVLADLWAHQYQH